MSWVDKLYDKYRKAIQIILISLTVFLIAFLFPGSGQWIYEYDLGERWMYDDLIAQYDFAILKDEKDIEAEEKAIRESTIPVVTKDQEAGKEILENYNQGFNDLISYLSDSKSEAADVIRANPGSYRKAGTDIIRRALEKGILKMDSILNQHEEVIILGNEVEYLESVNRLLQKEDISVWVQDQINNDPLPYLSELTGIVSQSLQPNLHYNTTISNERLEQRLSALSRQSGFIEKGEVVVEKNQTIDPDVFRTLKSYEEHYKNEVLQGRSQTSIYFGYLLLTSLVISMFVFFIHMQYRFIMNQLNRLTFLLFWIVVFTWLTYGAIQAESLNAYLVPFCIVPLVVKNFFTERLAIFTHIVVVLVATTVNGLGYNFTFLQILAGVASVLGARETREWSLFFRSVLVIFLVYSIGFLGTQLVKASAFWNLNWPIYGWLFFNAILVLLAYPLIPLFERLFGFISSITIAEYTDFNRPLLKELSLSAPGTFQHSLQVANMAESAAELIGANSLSIKAGALYHDIGKIKNPNYFVENQGAKNPHNDLSPEKSAEIIIGHVLNGINLAKEHDLPSVIIDFIRTHHGTSKVEYFYRQHMENVEDADIEEGKFTYPGPKPRSKEEAILMMADSTEAACRSLKNPTPEKINDLVNKIIGYKMSTGQLNNSSLTFLELESCQELFKRMLKSIHHSRIEYPEVEESEKHENHS